MTILVMFSRMWIFSSLQKLEKNLKCYNNYIFHVNLRILCTVFTKCDYLGFWASFSLIFNNWVCPFIIRVLLMVFTDFMIGKALMILPSSKADQISGKMWLFVGQPSDHFLLILPPKCAKFGFSCSLLCSVNFSHIPTS